MCVSMTERVGERNAEGTDRLRNLFFFFLSVFLSVEGRYKVVGQFSADSSDYDKDRGRGPLIVCHG